MQQNNDIQHELKELQVQLPDASLPFSNPPSGYFEQFQHTLTERIQTEDFLHKLPKQTPHAIPDGYFESFSEELAGRFFLESLPKSVPYDLSADYFTLQHDAIMRQTAGSAQPMSPLRMTLRRLAPLSMAASIALLLGIGYLFMNPSRTVSVEQQVAALSPAEIESYIQQHQLEFDTDLSVDILDDNQVDLRQLESDILDQNLNSLSEEELSSYIL